MNGQSFFEALFQEHAFSRWSLIQNHPRAKLHLYGKREARSRRKMDISPCWVTRLIKRSRMRSRFGRRWGLADGFAKMMRWQNNHAGQLRARLAGGCIN